MIRANVDMLDSYFLTNLCLQYSCYGRAALKAGGGFIGDEGSVVLVDVGEGEMKIESEIYFPFSLVCQERLVRTHPIT